VKLNTLSFGLISLAYAANAAAQAAPPPAPAPAAPPPAAVPAPAAPPPAAAPAPAAPPPAAAPAPAAPPPAAAPAPAPELSPVAPAPVVVAPVVAPPAEPPPPPKTLEVGSGGGFWQPGGLLQFWILASHQDMRGEDGELVADEDTFTARVRRAEFRVKGDILPKQVQFQIMIDAARVLDPASSGGSVPAALSVLQDFFITFPTDFVDISLGQFKVPVSYEGYNSSSKILFPERAPVSRRFGDRRDIGIRLEKKIGEYFMYSAGVFNGAGQNKLDNDTEKDLALRLEVYPFEGITVAGVGYATVGKRERSSRDRVEADIRYDAHNLYVLGEYIHSWDTTGGGPAVEGHGGYVEAAYTFFKHLQPMVRVGDLEPNMDATGDHFWHFEGGVNWLFHKNEAKIGLAVAHYSPSNEAPPANPKKTEGIIWSQVAF
jgi:hypothetical protein